jgi:hypothetical protein
MSNELEVLAHGPIAMLERDLEQLHADRHTPHEGRIEHSDQNHVSVPTLNQEPGRSQGLRQFNLDTLGVRALDALQVQGRSREYLQTPL